MVLKDLVRTEKSFSTQELLTKILHAPDFPFDQYPRLSQPRLVRLQGIVLVPLAQGFAKESPDIQRTGDTGPQLENSNVNNSSFLSKLWSCIDVRMPLGPGCVRLEWTCVRPVSKIFNLFYYQVHTNYFRCAVTLPMTTFGNFDQGL